MADYRNTRREKSRWAYSSRSAVIVISSTERANVGISGCKAFPIPREHAFATRLGRGKTAPSWVWRTLVSEASSGWRTLDLTTNS
jgi:hypothetical protein